MNDTQKTKDWTEFSRKGGRATMEKYGREHFSELARKSTIATREKYGSEYYKQLSRKGVEARQKKRAEALSAGALPKKHKSSFTGVLESLLGKN